MSRPDPYYSIPLDSIKAGPGKISQNNVDEKGFWTGLLDVGGKSLEIAGFEKGPLNGLVKVGVDSVGEFATSSRSFVAATARAVLTWMPII